jgi:hypothetical protein
MNLLLKLAGEQISLTKAWEQIDQFTLDYDQINVEAEAFPTRASDFKKATRRDSLVPFALPEARASVSEPKTDLPQQ